LPLVILSISRLSHSCYGIHLLSNVIVMLTLVGVDDRVMATAAAGVVKSPPTVAQYGVWLRDEKEPIAKRMRCCFKLRQIATDNESTKEAAQTAIDALASGMAVLSAPLPKPLVNERI
jgi:hypothetical protein